MIKNIQKKLLLHHPLLWNTKIIPFGLLALLINLIFLALGYYNGSIDFSVSEYTYNSGTDTALIVFVSIVLSLLVGIVWMVLYSRNNAFKSFYPKSAVSLYAEWLLILVFCIFNVGYSISYLYGKELRAKTYFTEKEFARRTEIISLSSMFVEGDIIENPQQEITKNGEVTSIPIGHFSYKGKEYPVKSLINKRITSFEYTSPMMDSLNQERIKGWLTENRKDSVRWLFQEFFKIVEDHKLKSSITPESWLKMVYTYPDFSSYPTIGRVPKLLNYSNTYFRGVKNNPGDYSMYALPIDSTSIVTTDNGAIGASNDTIPLTNAINNEYDYYKYYVPYNALLNSYGQIAEIQSSPIVNSEFVLYYGYLPLMLSLCIFSFRVTSGRNWLIGLVSLGITGIIVGILSAVISFLGFETTFTVLYCLVFAVLLIYFIVVCYRKTSKGISGITLNPLLWLLPAFLPIIYTTIIQISNRQYYNYRYDQNLQIYTESSTILWMEDHVMEFMLANIVLVFILMFYFAHQIRKWKAVAEA